MYGYLQKYEVIRVNGENGARALQMMPNSSVLLLDDTAPIEMQEKWDDLHAYYTDKYAEVKRMLSL